MSSALEEIRAQRQAVEDVRARLIVVAELLNSIRRETTAMTQAEALRTLLLEEQRWLQRAEDVVDRVQRFRELETSRFWPAVWRRWAMSVALILAAAVAAGAGYVWAARPYQAELAALGSRAELGDSVAQRLFQMAPGERRQFEVLMKWNEIPKR